MSGSSPPATPSAAPPSTPAPRATPGRGGRRILWIGGVWLLSLGALWGWTAWQASGLRAERDRLDLGLRVEQATRLTLQGQMALAAANFGEAAARFESAREASAEAHRRVEALGLPSAVPPLAEVQSQLEIARALAERTDRSASPRSAEALRLLLEVLETTDRP